MEKKKDNKKIYMISGIIILIIVLIIGIIIMNLNNNEKYVEVSKRILPQMKDFLVETVEYSVDLKKEALSILQNNKYYSDEEAINIVKQDNSYKYYEMKIDEKMSEMYNDLEYLKKHNYSKNRELSNQIKDVVEQFETSIQEHKELKVDTSYSNESRNLYEEIQELQNKINRE